LDEDFETLRMHLLRSFPQTIIPPLPAPTTKALNAEQIASRKVQYQRFLNAVLKSQILRTSTFLVAFLKESN
jgi:hypothetical protein